MVSTKHSTYPTSFGTVSELKQAIIISPHQVQYLLTTCCATTMCYFASMTRSRPPGHQNHQACLASDHCIVNHLQKMTPPLCHVSEDCECGPITVPEDQILDIIEHDGIPLLTCKSTLTDSSSVSLVKHKRGLNYTAISHVRPPLSNFLTLEACT